MHVKQNNSKKNDNDDNKNNDSDKSLTRTIQAVRIITKLTMTIIIR